ncbi:MAG: hypothetical protein WCG07_00080 [Candidatus Taylorbacteria bacterium]
MTSRDYFKGKRVAVIGLGPHGEMITDIKFLIKAGALVAVYDVRSEARLKNHLVFLRSIGLANYVCGSIPADDLLDMDLIILSHEYPRTSRFLKVAQEKKIQIEYPETLFFKLAPPLTVVGVMGSCGKATVVSMLEPLLQSACDAHEGQGFFVIDPETALGTLSHLKKAKSGDIILIRIVDLIMKELFEMRISPHVAIFTTIPPKGAYFTNPFEIVTYQTYNNFIVASDEVIDATHRMKFQPKAKMLRTKRSLVPEAWLPNARASHDRDNAALAFQTARLFKVPDETAQSLFESWKALKGRLEFIKKVKHIEFYNDTASICSYSTESAVQTFGSAQNTILVFGGVDTGCEYGVLYGLLPTHVKEVILLPGSGTMKERLTLQSIQDVKITTVQSLEEATILTYEHAQPGDKVLFSPGFEAGGFDRSRKERGERFVKAVRGL